MSDHDVKRNVEEELEFSPFVRTKEVGVTAMDGVITLLGVVSSYSDKYAVETAAKRVYGVKGIVNELTVELPMTDERSDTELAGDALTALRWQIHLPNAYSDVTVKASKGWLTLEGSVDMLYQKQAAENAVSYLFGVKGVINELKVNIVTTPKDVHLAIEKSIKRNASLDSKHISVKVQGNTAILSGKVHSWHERDEADWAAAAVPGITKVENNITFTY
jgi:osmotically-inducible protein OsmY